MVFPVHIRLFFCSYETNNPTLYNLRWPCFDKLVQHHLYPKKRLIETVLLSTHNICFCWEIRFFLFCSTLVTKGMWHFQVIFACFSALIHETNNLTQVDLALKNWFNIIYNGLLLQRRTCRFHLTLILLIPDLSIFENTVDPDQLASNEAIWSGSTLFSIMIESTCNNWIAAG